MSLRDLDDRLVPRIAAALDRVVHLFPKPPEPTGPLPVILRLRRLDDRFTSAGPLALLRDVPQLGAVLIGLLVLVSAITARARLDPRQAAGREDTGGTPTPAPPEPGDGTLGPQIAENVPRYVAGTKARLRLLAPQQPDGTVVAVVSFSEYLTPEEVRDLVGPLQVRKLFYRGSALRLSQTITRTVEVTDLVGDARQEFERIARELEAGAKDNRELASSIPDGASAQELEQKKEHERDAALWEREARQLRGTCACVYGAVVRGRLRLLVDLLNLDGIRTIDASAVDALYEDLTYTALLPEETKTVTGGNQDS